MVIDACVPLAWGNRGRGSHTCQKGRCPGHLSQPCPAWAGRPLSQRRGQAEARVSSNSPQSHPLLLISPDTGLAWRLSPRKPPQGAPSRGVYCARWGRRPHGGGGVVTVEGGAHSQGHPFLLLRPPRTSDSCSHSESSPSSQQNPAPPPLREELGPGLLGEDVVGLVLHQHLHAPDVRTPHLQAVLHPLDLRTEQGHGASGCPRGSTNGGASEQGPGCRRWHQLSLGPQGHVLFKNWQERKLTRTGLTGLALQQIRTRLCEFQPQGQEGL